MIKISKYFLGALCSVAMLFMLTSCVGESKKEQLQPTPKPEYLKVVKSDIKQSLKALLEVTIQFSEPVVNDTFNVETVRLKSVAGGKPLELNLLNCKNIEVLGGDTVCKFFALKPIGNEYSLTIAKDVTSLSGKKLENEYNAELTLALNVVDASLIIDQDIVGVQRIKATIKFSKPIKLKTFNKDNVNLRSLSEGGNDPLPSGTFKCENESVVDGSQSCSFVALEVNGKSIIDTEYKLTLNDKIKSADDVILEGGYSKNLKIDFPK